MEKWELLISEGDRLEGNEMNTLISFQLQESFNYGGYH